jgi:hypothetical protein
LIEAAHNRPFLERVAASERFLMRRLSS